MSKTKQHYDFLPEGWYFIVEDEAEYDETRLYTASSVEVAWSCDRSNFLRVLEGMEHESEFIQSLFDQKSTKDRYDDEQRKLQRRAERAQTEQENLEKVRRDFEKINRPQPAMPSLAESSKDLSNRIEQFKQKWF